MPPLGHSFVGKPVFVSQGCLNFHSKNSVRLNRYSSRTQQNAVPSPQIWNYIPSPGANSTDKRALSRVPHGKQQRVKIMRAQIHMWRKGKTEGRVAHRGMGRQEGACHFFPVADSQSSFGCHIEKIPSPYFCELQQMGAPCWCGFLLEAAWLERWGLGHLVVSENCLV